LLKKKKQQLYIPYDISLMLLWLFLIRGELKIDKQISKNKNSCPVCHTQLFPYQGD